MLTILHLYNSVFFKLMLGDLISQAGYNYIAVSEISTFYSKLENEKVDIIFIPFELKEEKVEDFIFEIKKRGYGKIPISIVTSTENILIRKKMFDLGIIDFIPKNIPVERLKTYILKFLNSKFNVKKEITEIFSDLKIALIDDFFNIKVIKKIFEINNIKNIDYFENPEEFVNSNKSYDLYIIEILTEKYTGEEIIMKIRDKDKNSLIIASSVIKSEKAISNFLAIGADDYIAKPFDEELFIRKLGSNVKRYKKLKLIEN